MKAAIITGAGKTPIFYESPDSPESLETPNAGNIAGTPAVRTPAPQAHNLAFFGEATITGERSRRVVSEPRCFNKINQLGGASGKTSKAVGKQTTPHSIGR